ncbi:MAG: hypothetical protein KBA15_04800 [Spirochaetes bacterium]|nr:hypothetical protein [Spirochaetota bacterium]
MSQAASQIKAVHASIEDRSFISFVEACADKKNGLKLATEFYKTIKNTDVQGLEDWFSLKGFVISKEECRYLFERKDLLADFRINIMNEGY